VDSLLPARSTSSLTELPNNLMVNCTRDSTTYASSLRDSTTYTSSLTLSAVEHMLLPVVPNPEPTDGVVGGARAYFRACALQAATIGSAAANDAAAVDTAHSILLEKHGAMFLQKAFGINTDGTPFQDEALVPPQEKKYKSVKTVQQYEDMILCLSFWGDDDFLQSAKEDNIEAI
jgi:hypothetical protein